MKYKSVYDELKANQIPMNGFRETLYVLKSEKSLDIIKKHGIVNFNEVDGVGGNIFLELYNQNIPYFYSQFFEKETA